MSSFTLEKRALACWAVVLTTFSGCGAQLPQVTGSVTLDGEPLSGGFVSFQPLEGGAMATAKIAADGSYTLQTGGKGGVAAGRYGVAITAYNTRPSADGQNPPQFSLASPKKYNDPTTSGFEVEVQPGKNEFNFPLESGE